LACAGSNAAHEEQATLAVQGPPLDTRGPQWTLVAPPLLRDESGPAAKELEAMRRSYGARDMKLSECTKVGADGTITGTRCPSGCVVFGPYVPAPPQSNVHVSFELYARGPLEFSSDMVTDVKLTRGRVGAQHLATGELRKLEYDVYLPDAGKALEARIWINAQDPAAFEVRNLSVRVQ
jgi:hypothetical protein